MPRHPPCGSALNAPLLPPLALQATRGAALTLREASRLLGNRRVGYRQRLTAGAGACDLADGAERRCSRAGLAAPNTREGGGMLPPLGKVAAMEKSCSVARGACWRAQ